MPKSNTYHHDTPGQRVRKTFRIIQQKNFLISFFLLFVLQSSFATVVAPSDARDTVGPPVNDYKLGREQFYSTYGRDDSSRALISFYFHKRNNAKQMAIAGAALAILSLVIGGLVIANNSTTPGTVDNVDAAFGVVFFGFAFYGSLALMIIGIVRWSIFSRKKLMRLLEDYFAGRSIPSHISKSKLFNQWLSEEKNRHLHL